MELFLNLSCLLAFPDAAVLQLSPSQGFPVSSSMLGLEWFFPEVFFLKKHAAPLYMNGKVHIFLSIPKPTATVPGTIFQAAEPSMPPPPQLYYSWAIILVLLLVNAKHSKCVCVCVCHSATILSHTHPVTQNRVVGGGGCSYGQSVSHCQWQCPEPRGTTNPQHLHLGPK